jgi:hypothetical protein
MTTKTVSIYHNVAAHGDGFFGLNTVFRTADSPPEGKNSVQLDSGGYHYKDTAQTHTERHPLVLVFQYTVDDQYDQDILNDAWCTFNESTSKLAQTYRSRHLRSLSVGDVVVIDHMSFSVASVGFGLVTDTGELRIVWNGTVWLEGDERQWLQQYRVIDGRSYPPGVTDPWYTARDQV